MVLTKASCSYLLQSVPVVSVSHGQEVLQALHKQQQSGVLCDLDIVIESEKIPAHKSVLAASSKYFSALFEIGQDTDTAGSKAGNVREIVLSSVPRTTFLPILHFMYTSSLHVFKENVHDILNIAKKLQIASIVKICSNLVQNSLILPSLKDSEQVNNNNTLESRVDKSCDVLYVDFGECNDSGVMTTDQSPNIRRNADCHQAAVSSESTLAVQVNPVASRSSFMDSEEKIPEVEESTRESAEVPAKQDEISSSNSNAPPVTYEISSNCQSPRSGRKYTCTQCKTSFKKRSNLNRHVLTRHASSRKFVCSKCGKKYAIKQSLQYHMAMSKCSETYPVPPAPSPAPSLGFTSHTPTSDVNCDFGVPFHQVESSAPSMQDYLVHTTVNDSLESLSDSNLLVQSLVSTNSIDSLTLMMPTTSLFPSLVNIQDDGMSSTFNHLDALNNIVSDNPAPRAHGAEDTFLCNGGNFMSDDDSSMPTIKSVQSIKSVAAYPESEVMVSHQSSIQENTPVSMSCTIVTTEQFCAPDTTTSATIGGGVLGNLESAPKLIKIAPKTPLMMPLKRQQKHTKLSTNKEKVPVVIRSPINITSLSDCLDLNSRLDHMEQSEETNYIVPDTTGSQEQSSSQNDTSWNPPAGKCNSCGKVFQSSEVFITHKRKCCKCPHCERVFSQHSNMSRHVKIFHTKSKPHKCNICSRAYALKQSLRFHIETKHGVTTRNKK